MIEIFSRNSNDECLGGSAVEFFGKMENFLWRVDVGELSRFLTGSAMVGSDLSDANNTGVAILGLVHASGIEEDYQFVVLGCLGEFWGELVESDNFNFGIRQLLRERIGGSPGNTVIATQRIAVGDDEDFGGHLPRIKLDVIPRRATASEEAYNGGRLQCCT